MNCKREWASEVTAFSSQYTSTSYSAKKILGKPNVYPTYSVNALAWLPRSFDANQYIELKFPEKIWLTHVNTYKSYNAGAVTRILAKNEEKRWIEIFRAPYAHLVKKSIGGSRNFLIFMPYWKQLQSYSKQNCIRTALMFPSRIFSPQIKRVDFPVNELRIEVDCTVSGTYVAIDAVEIVGGGCPRRFKKLWDSCYLIRKARVSADMAFVNCLEAGGYLANFETLEEAMRMKKILKKMGRGFNFYVGGRNINRRKPGGDWRWIKHGQMTEMKYYAFAANEPNGSDKSPQDCMFFYARSRYSFHNIFCDNGSHLSGYICEA
ncbi:C-type lectin domain family 6 member A-like [Saccostrea cucullata]|uniref:C-type lectin domain family 6 member A-like n=1 Tax=Saccostrea cuccullata TaxID=36930 RepID=UPI002ED50D21